MKKSFFIFSLLFSAAAVCYGQQSLTLTTYYPAPIGAYDQLRLVPKTPAPACTASNEGLFYYDSVNHRFQFCDGSVTSQVLNVWTQSANNIYLTDTTSPLLKKVGIGTSAPLFKLHLKNNGGMIAEGVYNGASDDALTLAGAGTRLIWYPKKAAFRAGGVGGAQWDDTVANPNTGIYSVAFGLSNTASGSYSAVLGGNSNTASGSYALIMGGFNNTATQTNAIANGYSNDSTGAYATISGGYSNTSSDLYSTVGGGGSNIASAQGAVVAGGGGLFAAEGNKARAITSTISGGTGNDIDSTATSATIGGGDTNVIDPDAGMNGTIGGGSGNTILKDDASHFGSAATIGGGLGNKAGGNSSTISGGNNNRVWGSYAFVGGGTSNNITATAGSGDFSAIGGGSNNKIDKGITYNSQYTTIGGGATNTITNADYATIGGGSKNTASGIFSTIAGGGGDGITKLDGINAIAGNTASGDGSTIGGGASNTASGLLSTVGGGQFNTASGQYSFVGGGWGNTASATWSSVLGGGTGNQANGAQSTVVGGSINAIGAAATGSTIGGGYWNTLNGQFSFMYGRNTAVNSNYSFVFNPTNNLPTINQDYSFLIFPDMNGVTTYTGIGLPNPSATLHVNGNVKIATMPAVTGAAVEWEGAIGQRVGLDIAELYETTEEAEVGDLLVIDETSDVRLKKSSQPYDPSVVGVVSGTPAIVFEGPQVQVAPKLGDFMKKSKKPAVALLGRVPCKVSLEGGAIKRGDLLTTSSTPGHAMKAADKEKSLGAIVGKALQPFTGGPKDEKNGVIMILIQPH